MEQKIMNTGLFALASLILLAVNSTSDSSIRLDGVISNDEWKGAKQYDLARGGKLMMKKENGDLYVALVAGKQAWAHVYLLHGDTVRVLHASAALGEAKYVKQEKLWRPVQSFNWELRDDVYNDALAKKQQDHYYKFGWAANNNNMGNGMVFEFKLDLSRADHNPAPFACVLAEIPEEFHYFPASLKDNTILKKLVQGYTPDSLLFDPSSWEKII